MFLEACAQCCAILTETLVIALRTSENYVCTVEKTVFFFRQHIYAEHIGRRLININ